MMITLEEIDFLKAGTYNLPIDYPLLIDEAEENDEFRSPIVTRVSESRGKTRSTLSRSKIEGGKRYDADFLNPELTVKQLHEKISTCFTPSNSQNMSTFRNGRKTQGSRFGHAIIQDQNKLKLSSSFLSESDTIEQRKTQHQNFFRSPMTVSRRRDWRRNEQDGKGIIDEDLSECFGRGGSASPAMSVGTLSAKLNFPEPQRLENERDIVGARFSHQGKQDSYQVSDFVQKGQGQNRQTLFSRTCPAVIEQRPFSRRGRRDENDFSKPAMYLRSSQSFRMIAQPGFSGNRPNRVENK